MHATSQAPTPIQCKIQSRSMKCAQAKSYNIHKAYLQYFIHAYIIHAYQLDKHAHTHLVL